MIPQKDLDQLIQYYKGELTENALLNKAATLAAKKHVLLADPQLPPAIVNAQTKPLSQELTKLTKRIRQFPGGAGVGAPGGPPGRTIKGSPSTPNHKSLLQDSLRKVKRHLPVKFPSRKGLLLPVEEAISVFV